MNKRQGKRNLFCTTHEEFPPGEKGVPRDERRPHRGTRGATRGGNTRKKSFEEDGARVPEP